MPKRLVILGVELIVALVVVVAAALFWASYYVDTDEFRSRFADTLTDSVGRDVQLVGDININLWPKIMLEVNDLSINEDAAFGSSPFAHFNTIHINIQVFPLLRRQIVVDSILVDGLELAVISDKSGQLNINSLGNLQQEASSFSVGDWLLSISNIEIENTLVTFEDRALDRRLKMSGITLRTGQIAPDVPVPVTVESSFSWKEQGVKSDITIKGRVQCSKNFTDARLDDATVTATLYGDFLPEGVEPGQLTSSVTVDWDKRSVAFESIQAQFIGLRAEGNIKSSNLNQELSAGGHITFHPFKPSGLISRFAPEMPVKSVDGLESSALASFFQIDESGVRLKNIVATLDDITVRGDLAVSGFTQSVFDFDLRANTIDLDRYIPLFKTDTPFVWGDFNLPLFRAFKGKGLIRTDGLKVLDTTLSDIRLNVAASNAIVLDAGAIKEGQASLGGTMELVIGNDATENVPTLSLTTRIKAESQKDGFAFLQGDRIWLGGVGTIALDGGISTMSCPPEARSMGIVDHLNGDISISLKNGTVGIKPESGKRHEVAYSEAILKGTVSPRSGPSLFWNTNVSASFTAKGGAQFPILTVDAQGPFSMAWDEDYVGVKGVAVNASASVSELPQNAQRVTTAAKITYASDKKSIKIEEGFLRALETSINAHGSVNWDDDAIKGDGEFSITGANPKHLIKLLTGEDFETDDPDALRSWSLASRFDANEDGFILHDAKADIDGFKVTGQVVGNGYVHPMLSFSLSGGKLDIDRYLPPTREMTLEEKRAGKYVKAPSVRLPMEFLGALRLNGKAALEELKLAKIRVKDVTGDIQSDNGQIHVSQIVGTSYDGSVIADWSGEIHKEYLTTHLQLHVEDMQGGPFMKDVAGKDYIRGLTDVDIDVTSRGATDDDILKNLNGKVWTRINDGSYKFSGYPQDGEPAAATQTRQEAVREAKRARTRTGFNKAMGYFTAVNGVFNADKLRVEAPPILQSYGEGSFSLPDNSINIAIQNDFVAIPSVTIELTGRLTDPEVSIPTGRILNDTVSNILSIPLKPFKFLRDLFD